mgnify:CR=1 FL=1
MGMFSWLNEGSEGVNEDNGLFNAVGCLCLLAMYVDGKVTNDEKQTVIDIIKNDELFSNLSIENKMLMFGKMVQEVNDAVKSDYTDNLIAPKRNVIFDLGESEFAFEKINQVVNADGKVTDDEQSFIKSIYNPLYIYGDPGLGKTHLMHSIAHYISENTTEMRVMYVTSETFTNELIDAIRHGTITPADFRNKYRNIDVLLIDDIQFIIGKDSTQEEFFHTFNTLYDAQKQVILSSDRPPREVERLEERLRSRFEWGLNTDIQAPDLETRIAILKNKAQSDHFSVPDDVMVYIASRIDSNIRELEGALTRVVAFASLTKRAVNTELVAEALKDIFPNGKAKEVTMDVIQEIVASYFKIKIEDLQSKKRTRNIAYPRQIAMYLCREMTETSLPQIGQFFGGRDHTTVIHAYDKISQDKDSDTRLGGILNELIDRIQKV